MTPALDPWPRALRRAAMRALGIGALLACVSGVAGADAEVVALAFLLGGVAAVATFLERAPLPAALDAPERRALLAWPLSALWLAGAAVQVTYATALRSWGDPAETWLHAWSYFTSFGVSPLLAVAAHALVTSFVPVVVLFRLTTPSLADQLRRGTSAAGALGATLCLLLVVVVKSRASSGAMAGASTLAAIFAGLAAGGALVALRLFDLAEAFAARGTPPPEPPGPEDDGPPAPAPGPP